MRIKDYLWKWLGPKETVIESNSDFFALAKQAQFLQEQIDELELKIARLDSEIKETQKMIFQPAASKDNVYKFRPTMRSSSEITQVLESRSFRASIMAKEAPKAEDIK